MPSEFERHAELYGRIKGEGRFTFADLLLKALEKEDSVIVDFSNPVDIDSQVHIAATLKYPDESEEHALQDRLAAREKALDELIADAQEQGHGYD